MKKEPISSDFIHSILQTCNTTTLMTDFAFFWQFWPIKIKNKDKIHWLVVYLDHFDRFIYKSVCRGFIIAQ